MAKPSTTATEKKARPTPQTVVLRVTAKIGEHYTATGAFPKLRPDFATDKDGNSHFYWMSIDEAKQVRSHAEEAYKDRSTPRGLKCSYGSHLQYIDERIQAAEERVALINGTSPKCEYAWPSVELWIGTKQQLQAMGIGVGVAFPGEPGAVITGKSWQRGVHTQDKRGFSVCIEPNFFLDLYDARIDIPKEHSEALKQQKEEEERQQRKERLAIAALREAPKTKAEYREHMERRTFWLRCLRSDVASGDSGYRISDEDVAELDSLFEEIETLLSGATIVGNGPAKLLQQKLGTKAREDAQLQAFLATMKAGASQGEGRLQ